MISGLSLCRLIMNRWQFEELIDAINSPDWWTLGISSFITIVNVAIMVWIGWKQVKLQRTMNLATFYTEDSELYKAVLSFEREAKGMLVSINSILYFPKYRECYFARCIETCDSLRRTFLHKEIDLLVKANVDTNLLYSYIELLDRMTELARWLDEYLKEEKIISNTNNNNWKFTDAAYVSRILGYIKCDRQEELNGLLQSFIESKKRMLKHPISKKML